MFCSNHSHQLALYRCYKCKSSLCEECVEHKAKSGREIVTCRNCGAVVEELVYPYANEFYVEPLSVLLYPVGFKRILPFVLVVGTFLGLFKFLPNQYIHYLAVYPWGPLIAVAVWLLFPFVWTLDVAWRSFPSSGFLSSMVRLARSLVMFLVAGVLVGAPLFGLYVYAFDGASASVLGIHSLFEGLLENPARLVLLIAVAWLVSALYLIVALVSSGWRGFRFHFNPVAWVSFVRKHVENFVWLSLYMTIPMTIAIVLAFFSAAVYGVRLDGYAAILSLTSFGMWYLVAVFGVFAGWQAYYVRHHLFDYEYVEPGLLPELPSIGRHRASVASGGDSSAGASPETISLLEKKLSLTPEDADLMAELIEAYESAGRISDAEKLGARLIGLYIRNQRIPAAAEVYEKFYAHNKSFTLAPFIMMKLGDFYQQQKRWNASCLVYRNLAVYHADSPLASQALYKCAYLLSYRLNRHDAAISALRKLMRDFPDTPVKEKAEELLARLTINDTGIT